MRRMSGPAGTTQEDPGLFDSRWVWWTVCTRRRGRNRHRDRTGLRRTVGFPETIPIPIATPTPIHSRTSFCFVKPPSRRDCGSKPKVAAPSRAATLGTGMVHPLQPRTGLRNEPHVLALGPFWSINRACSVFRNPYRVVLESRRGTEGHSGRMPKVTMLCKEGQTSSCSFTNGVGSS